MLRTTVHRLLRAAARALVAVQRETATSAFLLIVHSGVSASNERLWIIAVLGVHRNAHTGRQAHHMTAHNIDHVERPEDLPCYAGGAGLIRNLRQQDEEFISAMTTHRVGGAHSRLQVSRCQLYHLIPDRVPERVVDPLEMVEI